jgi:DNA-binding transcriptional LysR family regulator
MQDLNDLFFFAQVVEHRGFAQAGRALGMPKSKLSRRIALLEQRLGVRLIQRSSRSFSVTEIGEEYYRHCKAMLIEAEAAEQAIELSRSEPRGVVRITCPIALLHARVSTMLAAFMREHPHVTIHLDATNRRVDVIGERVDVAIRARPAPIEDSDLVIRILAERAWCLVARPSLFAGRDVPALPADLSGLPSLDLESQTAEHAWELEGPGRAVARIPHEPRYVTDDMVALRAAAVAGVGVVGLPTMIVEEELRERRLIKLIPEWTSKPGIVHAVFPSRRGLLPSVRALIEFLARSFDELQEK